MKAVFDDHSAEVLDAMEMAVARGLEECGLVAEGYAKKLCPVDTGNLRNSITHHVNAPENAVYIGTNVEYAAYVECGTGNYYAGGVGGRPTPWTYKDDKGNHHMTHGQRAQPYIKPAVADHMTKYQAIIQRALKGG